MAENQNTSAGDTWAPTPEKKGKATQLRMFAGLLWLGAIIAQVIAIILLFRPPVSMTWIIILIVIDLALVIAGAMLWKQSNRLDPASEKNKLMFFMQSQLGLVAAVVGFLPLVVFILTSKNLDAKQKGILGSIAGVAMVIAGIAGFDFNPPSVEEYTEQTKKVEELTDKGDSTDSAKGDNKVYWTAYGKSYHLYEDCSHINSVNTTEIFSGTVAESRELKNITDLCDRCENRAVKEKEESTKGVSDAIEEVVKQ
jgi:hypothetical protein